MLIALTREVSPTLAGCELTHVPRRPIDAQRARAQHHAYEEALRAAGCEVRRLPELPDQPDAVFVEDTAVVTDEVAVIARPGAASRRPEAASVERVLEEYRPVVRIESPGTLDGGDVLRVGKRVFVGLAGRTNAEGMAQLAAAFKPFGYSVTGVPVTGCLHLKSAVTQVAGDAVLLNRWWVRPETFAGFRVIEIDPAEPYAANGLLVGGRLIYPSSFPATQRRLEAHKIAVVPVEVTELQKAEGAVTCCSIIFTP